MIKRCISYIRCIILSTYGVLLNIVINYRCVYVLFSVHVFNEIDSVNIYRGIVQLKNTNERPIDCHVTFSYLTIKGYLYISENHVLIVA